MKARFTTIKLFLMQHLFVVGLVLLFVVLSFCSCGRAAADSMQVSSLEDILTFIDGNFNSTQLSSIQSAYNNNQYYMFMNYSGKKFIYFFDDLNLCPSNFGSMNGSVSYGDSGYYRQTAFSQGNYKFTCFYYNGSSWFAYSADTFTLQGSKSGYYLYSTNLIIPNGFSRASNDSPFYSNDISAINHIYRNFSGKLAYYNYGSDSSSFIDIESNTYSYISDDRLKFSTSLTGDGSKLLNIDLSAFRGNYTPAASYTFSDVVLHLDCDGSDVSFIINDSNSELINTWNPSNNRYVFVTPYSVFDLGSYDDVYISGVDFSLTHSSPGGSDTENFKISAEYFLKHETAPIESDSIPLDNQVDADKLSVTEIQNINNDFTFSEGEYVTDLGDILPPDNFTFVEIGLSNLSISDLVSDGIQISDYYYFITDTVTSVMSEERVIYKFLNDTSYPNTFDYILFDYIEKVDGVYDHYYFYYITVSGRIRMQNNILADLYFDVNQTAYNTSSIYDYLYNRLNDFEDKSLVAFNSIIGLDRQQVQWLSTLNNTLDNGFDSVVAAINNIDIPEPTVFDDTDILDKLDDLLTAVQDLIDGNEVDTPQECIQFYYDNQDGTVDVAFVPAYYEGMTLDFLYSLQGVTENNNRTGTKSDSKSGSGPAILVNNSLLIQIYKQFKDSFTDNFIPQNIRVFLSDITNDTGNHLYYFQLFHNDYDPEDFDGLAD